MRLGGERRIKRRYFTDVIKWQIYLDDTTVISLCSLSPHPAVH